MRRDASAALALTVALLCGATAFAATPAQPRVVLDSPGNYHIETETEEANLNTGAFKMPKKVMFSRPGTDATADSADGNYKNGTVSLIGNVVVHDNGNASEAGGEAAYRGNGPATLTCNRLDVDSKAKTYTAIGNVHFSQGSRTGTSERAVLNRTSGTLVMQGDVHLSDGPSNMTASNLEYNLNTKDVRVTGAPIVITQPVPSAAPGTPRPSAAPRRR